MNDDPVFHVLFVEDSPEDIADARLMLLRGSARRYKFTEVDTGEAALRALRGMDTPPDCIVLDFKLPDMNALDVLSELRAEHTLPLCPVVVLTAVAETGPLVLHAGAQEFVGKSWASPESLTRAIESAVERFAMTRERQRVSDALRTSESMLRLFVQNAPAAVAQFDREMRYICASGRWQRDFGLADDIIGRSHFELLPNSPDLWSGVRRKVLAGETHYSAGDRVNGANGRVLWLRWEALPWHDDTGGIGGILVSIEDISERVQAEQESQLLASQLAEAARRKDEFLATLAHELRNPLAPIRNGLRILALTGGRGEPAEEACAMIERQVEQLVHLVDDLLDVNRIREGKLQLRLQRIPLATALSHAVETSRPLLDAGGHRLTIGSLSPSIVVLADITRLTQVFANLLNNATKFSRPETEIEITVGFQQQDVLIRVRDTGVGIAPHMLANIFQMFSQVDQSLEKTQGGLGIGLCLVKQIVELHGGTVAVSSDGLGCGSEFTVRLPLAPPDTSPALPPSVVSKLRTPIAPLRILVADDNADAADSLSTMLALLGHDVRTAGDGQMAVAIAETFRPEVLLLDIGMPKLNGHDAGRQIRAQPWGKEVTLIALTGWGQEEVRQQSLDAGFDRHLVKPVDFTILTDLLSSIPASRTP